MPLNMSQIYLDHIPKRIQSKIALVSSYVPIKQQMKVLVLTTDRRLLELIDKEIIFELDLTKSVLNDVNIPRYTFEENPIDPNASNISQRVDSDNECIHFGKYIAYGGSKKRLFIIIKVFDKLVVVERIQENGFKVMKEYSSVDRFEIVDRENNYRAVVVIHFRNSSTPIYETFAAEFENNKPSTSKFAMEESYRMALDRISEVKTELAVQRIATRKHFVALKDKLMFGPDLLRSDMIEEKQQLGKYGDVWMKLVGDFLVIGIPVINNCSKSATVDLTVRCVQLPRKA